MIKEITREDLQKAYSKNTDLSDFALRRIKFDLSMFDTQGFLFVQSMLYHQHL